MMTVSQWKTPSSCSDYETECLSWPLVSVLETNDIEGRARADRQRTVNQMIELLKSLTGVSSDLGF